LALDAANDGLWDWNVVTGEVYFSPRYYTMLGYMPYELEQSYQTWASLLHPDERGQAEKHIKDYIERKAPSFEEEFRMRTKQGTWKWILSRGKVVERDDQGRSVRMIGTHVDISAMKESQQKLERLSKDLELKNEELESIVYTASHDLRSPLINIQGFSGELSSCCGKMISALEKDQITAEEKEEILRVLKEEVPASLGYIINSSEKMDKLLDGLLRLSRLGRSSLEFAELDMNVLMGHIVSDMQYQINDSGVQLNVEELPSCIGDYGQISQVFTNLVSNSIKYLCPDRPGEIRISGRVEGEMSVYCVEDNGLGISPEYYNKVFDIFHRLNPSDKADGEGLGLTIVRRILDRHDGKVWLESEPGSGSRFYVSVPRFRSQPESLQ